MTIRKQFNRELQELQDEVFVLGSMVETAIVQSMEALKERDHDAAEKIITNDIKINEQRFSIEDDCVILIARQQPMASDLRTITAVLEIITDLERMADHASGIAKISLMIGDEPFIKPLIDLPRMAEQCTDMLRRALDAFVEQDVEAARRTATEDDEIDALTDQVYRELLTFMMQDSSTITQATYLMWVSHNLERIADRVTNVCERVVFTATGDMQELNP